MSEHPVVDVTIIGAGRRASRRRTTPAIARRCRIIESLEQLGGQVAAVYPEKHIFDIAGFPKINGQEYVDRMVEQGLQYGAEALLGEAVETLERVDLDGEELWAITTDQGGHTSRARSSSRPATVRSSRARSRSTAWRSGAAAGCTTSSSARPTSPASAA